MSAATTNEKALTFKSNTLIRAEIKRLSPGAKGLSKAGRDLLLDRLAETSLRSSYSALAGKRSGRPTDGLAYNLDDLAEGATWAEARIRTSSLQQKASHWTSLPALKKKAVCFLLDTCEICSAPLAGQPRFLAQGEGALEGLTEATYLPPRPAADCLKMACTGCADKANAEALAEMAADETRTSTAISKRATPQRAQGTLNLESPVEIEIKGRTHSKTATLNADGTVKMDGQTYSSPSKAASAVYGVARNGWKTWRLLDGSFINTLRA